MEEDRFKEARLYIEAALRALPNLPNAWLNLGRLREREGESEAAILCYRRTISLDPSNFFAWQRLANLLESKGEPVLALYAYQTALQIEEPTRHGSRALLLYQSTVPLADDVVPRSLVESCRPMRDVKAACEAYSRLASRAGVQAPDIIRKRCELISNRGI